MARQTAARAGDFTGKQKAELAAKHAEEQKEKAKSVALATATADAEEKEPVDLTPVQPEVQEDVVDDVAVARDVDVKEEIKSFRVNEDLEMVTIGHGNHYNFEVGRTYRAPKSIYDYLDERGFIWH